MVGDFLPSHSKDNRRTDRNIHSLPVVEDRSLTPQMVHFHMDHLNRLHPPSFGERTDLHVRWSKASSVDCSSQMPHSLIGTKATREAFYHFHNGDLGIVSHFLATRNDTTSCYKCIPKDFHPSPEQRYWNANCGRWTREEKSFGCSSW